MRNYCLMNFQLIHILFVFMSLEAVCSFDSCQDPCGQCDEGDKKVPIIHAMIKKKS